MSAADAAGWALSSDQSVSVVPMIQCRPHGMTNSTDFSVRRMRPESPRMRSRGTTRWMPLLARTWNWPRSPANDCVSSVQTPVALTTCWARMRMLVARLLVVHHARRPRARPRAGSPVTRARLATCAPYAAAVRAMNIVCRASSTWRVVVLQGAHQRVLAQRRHHPQGAAAGEVAVVGHAPRPPRQQRQRVVERDARTRVEPLPAPVLQRVQERHRPHEVRGEGLDEQTPLRQRLGDQPEVEHLQVAQAAVDQLAGAAGRAGGEVARLHQPHRQAPRGGVQRGPGPDHAAADDQDVELGVRHRLQGLLPRSGGQRN